MPSVHRLSKAAIKKIERAIDRLFDHAKARILGPQSVDKRIVFSFRRELSIPGLFEAAAKEEGFIPNLDALNALVDIAGQYVDSTRTRTKAKTVREVQRVLTEASLGGVETDVATVLNGALADVWKDTTTTMHAIIDAEASNAKNVSIMDGVFQANAVQGVEDPVVFFVIVRDGQACKECVRLHMMEDGVTPRVWKLSDVGHGYHKRGDPNPKIGGLHPHCRCTLTTLLPGFGFDAGGKVTFVSTKHNEYKKQRGQVEKSERVGHHLSRLRKMEASPNLPTATRKNG